MTESEYTFIFQHTHTYKWMRSRVSWLAERETLVGELDRKRPNDHNSGGEGVGMGCKTQRTERNFTTHMRLAKEECGRLWLDEKEAAEGEQVQESLPDRTFIYSIVVYFRITWQGRVIFLCSITVWVSSFGGWNTCLIMSWFMRKTRILSKKLRKTWRLWEIIHRFDSKHTTHDFITDNKFLQLMVCLLHSVYQGMT